MQWPTVLCDAAAGAHPVYCASYHSASVQVACVAACAGRAGQRASVALGTHALNAQCVQQ
eukprot:411334-Pelagomonas_calceolata.AAC.2